MAETTATEITIHNRQELLTLLTRRRKRGKITLLLTDLSKEEKFLYEKHLNHFYNHCGCNVGTVGAFIGTGIFICSSVLSVGPAGLVSLKSLLLLFIVFILSAGVGKAIGLQYARIKLHNLVIHLNRAHHVLQKMP